MGFKTSSKLSPCPICGRDTNGHCRSDGDLVLCHIGSHFAPPIECQDDSNRGKVIVNRDGIQWAFVGLTKDGRCATFKPHEPLDNNSSGESPAPPVGGLAKTPRVYDPPPQHWPDGQDLEYSPTLFTVVSYKEGKKRYNPCHIDEMGRVKRNAGDTIWPFWREQDAITVGKDKWVFEAEGEKCADMIRAGGLVCISHPGHQQNIDKHVVRYQRLKDAGVVGICYLADNDEKGKEKLGKSREAATQVGLKFIGLHAEDVWPGLPEKGSVDDAEGNYTERAKRLELAWGSKLLDEKEGVESSVEVVKEKDFTELLGEMLDCIIDNNEARTMACRAEIIARFRISESQIEARLFKLHMYRTYGLTSSVKRKSLDLTQISGLDYLVDGFIIDKKLNLFYGKAGSGKTTAALGAAFAAIHGKGYLDHTKPASKTKVLFIASDSGPAPLVATMQDMGWMGSPEVKPGKDQAFFVWAADQDQGQQKWIADLQGCIELESFIRENDIGLVLIDSCKAVCTGGSADYTSNGFVMGLLTYMEEVLCPHAAIVLINHDGRDRGATAGAKAWAEVPSAVHQIEMIEEDENGRHDDKRLWIVHKDRIKGKRRFTYEMIDGELKVTHGQEVIGNCLAHIVDELLTARQVDGKKYLTRQELYDRLAYQGGPATKKTISNTLSTAVRAKNPEVVPVNGIRGAYRLSRRVLMMFNQAA